jgi:acetate---CoA ligase (ADP-forming)
MSSEVSSQNVGAIFSPKSIAVVGASTRPGTVGNDMLRNLIFSGFQGPVYPVNPKSKSVLGIRAYTSVSDIPDPIDLAVIIVPAGAVFGVIDECMEKGVKGVVVISAGFKEVGGEGTQMELDLAKKVREAGIPLIGPNCLGVINTAPDIHMNATFARKMPKSGKLAFISQSGALCTSVLDYAEERNMGFSKFISFGNKADINEIDLLNYLATDDETSVIAMYLEDISDGRAFIETAQRIFWETGKPMLCIKSGRSPEGAKAVSSHTGSLAGSDSLYDALLIQAGVQRVDSIGELFDYAAAYVSQPMPKGNKVAIVTNAGGPGIMATDAAVRHGLKLADISEETKDAMRSKLPAAAALSNPIDVIGDAKADRYASALRTVMEDPNVDMGVVILTPQSMTDIEETAMIVPKAIIGIDKPIVCAFMGVRDVAGGVEILRENDIPNYPFPEDAVRALAAMSALSKMREDPRDAPAKFNDTNVEKASELIAEYLNNKNERYLTQAQCRAIFQCYNMPLLESRLVTSEDEAAKAVESIGKPVAMKVMSADVVHKYDAGGVMLNVCGGEGARCAYQTIYDNINSNVPSAKIDGILIEEMARKGVETILGANRDERFGPLMMFGLGGTFVEVLKDVSFRLAPMRRVSAKKMITQIRSFKILTGVRGNPPSDIASVEDTLLRLNEMVVNHPEIAELDINPLIVHEQGTGSSVADSRILLRRL